MDSLFLLLNCPYPLVLHMPSCLSVMLEDTLRSFPHLVGGARVANIVLCSKKCRFLDKRVHEISRFFVAPPRPLRLRASTHRFINKYLPSLVFISLDSMSSVGRLKK